MYVVLFLHPTSHEGNKYFVTFIDDFTHFVMICLLKNKSEFFEKFKDYQTNLKIIMKQIYLIVKF